MPSTIVLNENIQITLDGSGNGHVTIGPKNAYQVWAPSSAACNVSSNVNEPTFRLYLGSGAGGQFLGGTYTGSNDSTGLNGISLYPGQTLYGVWSGGDAGAVATLAITGTMEVP